MDRAKKAGPALAKKRNKRIEARKRKVEAFLSLAQVHPESGTAAKKTRLDDADADAHLKQEYHGVRALLREHQKQTCCWLSFRLKSEGYNASVENTASTRTPIFPSDLQQLLLYTMVGEQSTQLKLRWCQLTQWQQLSHVICLCVENMGLSDYLDRRDDHPDLSRVNRLLPDQVEMLAPASFGSNLARELSLLPGNQQQRARLANEYGQVGPVAHVAFRSVIPFKMRRLLEESQESPSQCDMKAEPPLKLRLLLSTHQMIEDNYPLPLPGRLAQKYEGYVFTKKEYAEVSDRSPLLSIDCEMCLTDAGKKEVAKVCVVDEHLNVVYQSLVKPTNPIVDYLTAYSGITANMLSDVTTRLSDVQLALCDVIPADAILVGQSLNFDLHALRLFHPYVIDTSVIYCMSGSRRRKTRLAVLAERFLGQKIQASTGKGHDPQEDAIAAMKLVQLKLKKGYTFGDILLENADICPKGKEERQPDQPKRAVSMLSEFGEKKDLGKTRTVKVVYSADLSDQYSACSSSITSEAASADLAVEAAMDSVFENRLTVCHVRLPESEEDRLRGLSEMAERLWERVSANGLFLLVLAGSADQPAMVGAKLKRTEKV